jgi:acyl-CoA thioesterase-1
VVEVNAAERKAILFLGNSLTAGYGLDRDQAFPALIQEKIDSLGWNFEVINAGQSGDTTAGGLRRLDWLFNRKFHVLVLELGANDGLRGVASNVTRKNLQTIIDRTKEHYPNVTIVLAGMHLPPNLGEGYASQFKAIFPDLAKRNSALLIPYLLEGVGGVEELNLADGIHPDVEGHKVVAENVWKVMEPILRSMK